jgi:hypothetical protein
MNPPTKYPMARVRALIQAWLQSGAVSRWWKASRNSSRRSCEACRSRVISSMAVEESPYGAKVSWTMLCVPEGSLSISSRVSRTVASYDSLEHVLAMDLVRIEGRFKVSYASLLAPTYPPRPMEMAPAASSARPPKTTTFVLPRADKPADRK